MQQKVKCLRCGKDVPEVDALNYLEYGIEPFCSDYCYAVYSGIPLPHSGTEGYLNHLKWEKKLEIKFRRDKKWK
jgi:hypothetical protein